MAPAVTPKAKKPRVSVLERRLQNPFGEPSSPIDLTDPSLVCRVFNKGVGSQQIYRAKTLGWEFVEPTQLVDVEQAGGFRVSTDGQRLVRGEREEEVLMFMPKKDRTQIEHAKAKKNVRDMQMGRQRDAIAQAASQSISQQAGDILGDPNRVKMVGNVTDNYERIQVTPETE
jgi:hypothetical protein